MAGQARTSSAGLGAGGPALERPLVGVRLLQEHVVAPNKGQQVLMDDVLVGQAAAGATLSWGEHLRGDRAGGTGLESREAGPAWGGDREEGVKGKDVGSAPSTAWETIQTSSHAANSG